MDWRRYVSVLLVLVGVFCISVIVMALVVEFVNVFFSVNLDSRHGIIASSMIQCLVVFIVPAFIVARYSSPSPLRFLRLDYCPGILPFIGVVFAYFIALPAMNQIIYWNANISFPDSLSDWAATLTELENRAGQTTATLLEVSSVGALLANIAVIGLLTALAEELFFRGTLQRAVALKLNPYVAVWIAAIIFTTLHFQFFGLVPRLLLGAWFGYLLLWTRSLYIPVFAHFLNNGLVVLFTWLAGNGISFDFENLGVVKSGFPFPAAVSLVAFVLFIVLFKNFFFRRHNGDFQGNFIGYKEA